MCQRAISALSCALEASGLTSSRTDECSQTSPTKRSAQISSRQFCRCTGLCVPKKRALGKPFVLSSLCVQGRALTPLSVGRQREKKILPVDATSAEAQFDAGPAQLVPLALHALQP